MSLQSATIRSAPVAPWRIGVDVGGTFTDMVLADATGATGVFKVPSEPADPGAGVVAALEMAARALKEAGAVETTLRAIGRRIGGDGPDDPLADSASGEIDADGAKRRRVIL